MGLRVGLKYRKYDTQEQDQKIDDFDSNLNHDPLSRFARHLTQFAQTQQSIRASMLADEEVQRTQEAAEMEYAFNEIFVGMRDGINVEPTELRIDPDRYHSELSVFYITNVSNGRQYLKVTGFNFELFELLHIPDFLDPGFTAVMEVRVKSIEFAKHKTPTAFMVYHSRIKHKDLKQKYEERYVVKLKIATIGEAESRGVLKPGPSPKKSPNKDKSTPVKFVKWLLVLDGEQKQKTAKPKTPRPMKLVHTDPQKGQRRSRKSRERKPEKKHEKK